MNPLVRVENLAMQFGAEPIFRGVTFDIEVGAHLAVLGPSGCGKSTLLRLLAGLDAPSEGAIDIGERQVSAPGKVLVPAHERTIAMVFQDLALWPNLTALDNVLLGLAQVRESRHEKRQQARDALRACGLESFDARRPSSLSSGQQQRVALARVLAVRPKLLLLDEPFSGLDIALKAQLFAEMRQLGGNHAVTFVLVTHDPLEATALCTNALVIERGSVFESGNLLGLLRQPTSATLRAFLQQLPTRRHDEQTIIDRSFNSEKAQ
ncbi:MAG: ATP-binding cassette domain-containing protein [Chthoniobacterales bacterium]|nr:ATP-binding cassette domain-containing protein [Chthoniobacterales bacterium]